MRYLQKDIDLFLYVLNLCTILVTKKFGYITSSKN